MLEWLLIRLACRHWSRVVCTEKVRRIHTQHQAAGWRITLSMIEPEYWTSIFEPQDTARKEEKMSAAWRYMTSIFRDARKLFTLKKTRGVLGNVVELFGAWSVDRSKYNR